MDLFRKKSVDQLVSESTPLKRTLKTFDLTMLGIGAIIRTGIFVLTGSALTAGPALCVSFLLAAVCWVALRACAMRSSPRWHRFRLRLFVRWVSGVRRVDRLRHRLGSDSGHALQAATVSAGWSGYFNKLLEGASACICRSN